MWEGSVEKESVTVIYRIRKTNARVKAMNESFSSPKRPWNAEENFGIDSISPRLTSCVKGENPLEATSNNVQKEGGVGLGDSSSYRIENLSNAVNITTNQLQELVDTLKGQGNNESRIDHLEACKSSYLFSSEDLLKLIVDVTPSVKTRIRFIEIIGSCSSIDGNLFVSYWLTCRFTYSFIVAFSHGTRKNAKFMYRAATG